MTNPFEDDIVTIKDDPEGQRVLLQCKVCDIMVPVAAYSRQEKLLMWKCPDGHVSEQGIDLDV